MVEVKKGTPLASFLESLVSFTYANLDKTQALPRGMSTADEWDIYKHCYTTELINIGNETTIADFIRKLKASLPVDLPTDALTIEYRVSSIDATKCRIIIFVNKEIDPKVLANPKFASPFANDKPPQFEDPYRKATVGATAQAAASSHTVLESKIVSQEYLTNADIISTTKYTNYDRINPIIALVKHRIEPPATYNPFFVHHLENGKTIIEYRRHGTEADIWGNTDMNVRVEISTKDYHRLAQPVVEQPKVESREKPAPTRALCTPFFNAIDSNDAAGKKLLKQREALGRYAKTYPVTPELLSAANITYSGHASLPFVTFIAQKRNEEYGPDNINYETDGNDFCVHHLRNGDTVLVQESKMFANVRDGKTSASTNSFRMPTMDFAMMLSEFEAQAQVQAQPSSPSQVMKGPRTP